MEGGRKGNEAHHTFYIETYGCEANRVDSEIIADHLKRHGWMETDLDSAEYVFVNTCGVKTPTEEKIIHRLNELKRTGKKLITLGCLVDISPHRVPRPAFGPRDYEKLMEYLGVPGFHYVPGIPGNRILRVNISYGCLGRCSYCATVIARGRLKSFPPQEILKVVEEGVKKGAKEVRLTAQDVGCYGYDLGTNIVELLEKILEIEGEFFVRVGMLNPRFLKDYAEDLADLLKEEKIYSFAHVPVQSGSNRVLELMNRGYTVEEFEDEVRILRRVRDVTLATDIIVGFPGEKEEDFLETVDLLKRVRPDVTNVSRYWPRPGTPASRMPPLPRETVLERSREVHRIVAEISRENNEKYVGRKLKVLFYTEEFGKALNYRSVYAPGVPWTVGRVKVVGAGIGRLKGVPI